MKKKLTVFLVMLLTLLFSAEVFAAIPSISSSRYIKMFNLSGRNDTLIYTNRSLNQRGTSYPYKAYNALIYGSDEIYVYEMNNVYALVSYPTSSGRKQGFVKTSSLSLMNFSQTALKSRYRINTYVRPGGASYGAIFNGDNVWTVARQGNYIQVVYPAGNVYKMAWITNADYNNYIAPARPITPTPKPAVTTGYIWPIPNSHTINTIYYYNNTEGGDGIVGGTHKCQYTANGNSFVYSGDARKKFRTNNKPYGIDINANIGDPVYPVANGTITFAGWDGDFGNRISIDHGNGRITVYAHLNKILVKTGTVVGTTVKIGEAGSTGGSSGPHLHFEMSWQNPYEYYKNTQQLYYSSPASDPWNREWFNSVTPSQRQAEYKKRH